MDLFKRTEEVQKKLNSDLSQIVEDRYAVENLRLKYIGKRGLITALFRDFATLDTESKRKLGKVLNSLKSETEAAISSLKERIKSRDISKEFFDYTLPGKPPRFGYLHPITKTMNEICAIFKEMGFEVEFGPEVETDYYNFKALNFPENHPARDMQDTFYIDDEILLRTHTSPIQVRVMEKRKPPFRILAPGRVFRNEAISPRSYCVFHQVEGLYVDKNVTFSELKGTLEIFCRKFFNENVKIRFRPSFFPFTEPSAEVDIHCFICGGTGCRVCKHTGWLEILGCGMVDPLVFKFVGIDPEKYSGYAFGMGPDRIAMLKYGIDDIRIFFNGDVRFLKQFY